MTRSFPVQRTCPYAPPPEYREFRAEAPLVKAGDLWLVTRHAEAQQVLVGTGISTDPSTPGHPGHGPADPEMEKFRIGQFIDLDPPEHTRLRKMLISEFSVRRIRDMRPHIQEIADGLIDAMAAAGSPADLVEAYGLALPSLVICELLGVPYADREFFQSRTRELVAGGGLGPAMEIRRFIDDLVTRAEKDPGDDLIGRLLQAEKVSHDELVGMAFLLLVAGHETTANMIPLSALTLLRNPEQLDRLRQEPELWPMAVDELLRYHSIVDWVAFDRVATEDQVIGGQLVRAGEGIYVLGASANRDERAFPDPDVLDLRRGARNHVAFGYGVHQCLGQNLARAELEIALRTLFERLPGLAVPVPDEELRFKYEGAIFGLFALPVTF
ncbi:MAG: cytochrome P450 [Nonomuraea sp.]|nr:cytochrome P450 [Nonomuraea sp.]